VLVSGIGGFGGGHGVIQLLIGICAGFGYALYSIFGGLASRRYSSLTVTFYTFLISGVSLLFISRPAEIIEKTDISMLPYILGVALICTTIPYISYTYGLKRMEASKAAVLVTVEPLVGCLLGMLVYHESHDLLKLLGIVSIFAAVILLSVTGRGQKAENTQKQ
jgi:drug/metabolite transporter (DMT)-like permease